MIGRVVGPLLVAALVIGSLPGEADAASDSAVRWSSYSESSQCGSPYVGTPVMSRSGSLADSERLLGPLGGAFGRTVSQIRSRLVWWTVPMSGGRRVLVHQNAYPAFQQVSKNLADEAAAGRYYAVRSVSSFVPRTVGGGRQLSRHTLGIAVDINAPQNPYSSDPDRLITNLPAWFIDAWEEAGFCWGGAWRDSKDPMHFAWMGPGAATGDFPLIAPLGGLGAFRLAGSYSTPAGRVERPILADAGGFGALDLVGLRDRSDGTIIDVVSGRSSFAECSHYRWLSPVRIGEADIVALGDSDGDSRVDLTVIRPDGTASTSSRASAFEDETIVQTGLSNRTAAAIGDLDGDRLGDLFTVDADGILTVSAGPGFTDVLGEWSLGSVPDGLAAGDRHGDGTIELFVLDSGVVTILVQSDGAWQVAETIESDLFADPVAFAVADEDGDGRADVGVLGPEGRLSVLSGNTSTGRSVGSWWMDPTYDCPDDPIPLQWSGVFYDDDTSVFEGDIESIAASGVTRGCNPPFNDAYCTDDVVTRGQMAAFLVRALGLPPSDGDHFSDDDGSVFEGDINALAAAGVTRGCAEDRFCLDDPVTRGQMAAFISRGYDLPPAEPGDAFVDDDASVFEGDIERLSEAGVTRGCNPPENTRYCPDDLVTRGQMAAFLVRARSLN